MNNSSDLVVILLDRYLKLCTGLLEVSESGDTTAFAPENLFSGGSVPAESSIVEKVGSVAETSIASGMLLRSPGSARDHQSVDSLGP